MKLKRKLQFRSKTEAEKAHACNNRAAMRVHLLASCALLCLTPALSGIAKGADTLEPIQVNDETIGNSYEDILADPNISDEEKAAVISERAAETGIYPTAYFDKFFPQNALDMIRQLPGFNLDGGSDARGFGGTAGNVLIDGARPTSKNGLEDTLRRIPAAQVDRIEVLRGGVGASDAAGQTVVANLVRIPGASTGTITGRIERDAAGRLRPRMSLAYSTTLDGWETSSRLTSGTWSSPRDALFINRDADGTLTSTTSEDRPERGFWAWYNGEASKDLFGGKLILNTRFGFDGQDRDFTRDIFEDRMPDGRRDAQTLIDDQNRTQAFELGADWSKTNSKDWKIQLVGFTQFEFNQGESLLTEEDNRGQLEFLSDFTRSSDTIESILRTTVGKAGSGKLKPEFGIEVAYNSLDRGFNLVEEDQNGVIELDVPSSNVKVAEIRGEAFTNLVWQTSKKLTVEGGLTYEMSRIKVTGDAAATQTFKFLKPTLTATFNVRDNLQIQAQAVRRVGQLDFNDFAATNDVGADRLLEGNPELRPDRTWRLSSIIDWRYSQRGSLRLEPFTEWRQDVLEQVILPTGGSGLGNAGSARVSGFNFDGVIPLDFALKGGLLELNYRRRWTSLFDPIIDADRGVSRINLEWLGFRFRQDLPEHRIAWGITRDGRFERPTFFVSEINRFSGNDRYSVFIETTKFLNSKIRLEVESVTGERFISDRTFFDPNRGAAISGTELREFTRGALVLLEITKQF